MGGHRVVAVASTQARLDSLGPLVWGALAYTVGAALEFARWPVPLPGIVGPHELFHLFVLAGVSWHFVYIWRLLPVEEDA
jgi:channel protein (hemolysin III family)